MVVGAEGVDEMGERGKAGDDGICLTGVEVLVEYALDVSLFGGEIEGKMEVGRPGLGREVEFDLKSFFFAHRRSHQICNSTITL